MIQVVIVFSLLAGGMVRLIGQEPVTPVVVSEKEEAIAKAEESKKGAEKKEEPIAPVTGPQKEETAEPEKKEVAAKEEESKKEAEKKEEPIAPVTGPQKKETAEPEKKEVAAKEEEKKEAEQKEEPVMPVAEPEKKEVAKPEKEAAAKEEEKKEAEQKEEPVMPVAESEKKEVAEPEKEAAAKEKEKKEAEQKEELVMPVIKPEQEEEKKKSETEQVAERVIEEPEKIGIDTIDLEEPQGNWLFKRMWWEHAEDRYEKIRELEQKIWGSRMHFFVKRTELDKTVLDPFYISMGIGQGELHEMLSELVNRLEKEREEEGILDQSERSLLTQLQAEQETLEQTKFDVESISKLDQEIDAALNRLMEQINRVRAYEREAWDYFKNIARVLNDSKARELFFKMDMVLRNLRDIDDYIQQGFTQHFNQLLQRIDTKINSVKNGIQRLKEKGIDFKKQLNDITVEEEQEVSNQDIELQENNKEEVPGWGTRVWDSFVAALWWPYEKLVGTKESNE